jgi:hypothetical protein
MTDYAALYLESHERIAALVREAGDEQRAQLVPGCPKRTVSDTVAHLAAVAVDALAGYPIATISADEHTAVQVEQRRGRPLEDVLGEWNIAAGPIEQALAAQRMSPLLGHDVLTHEVDIRGALGAGRPLRGAVSRRRSHRNAAFPNLRPGARSGSASGVITPLRPHEQS